MAENFDVCIGAAVHSAEECREILLAIFSLASGFVDRPVWTMRVRGHEVSEGEWSGEPVDVPDGWIVFFYPKRRSSAEGAVAVENVRGTEVWTVSLPVERTRERVSELEDLVWRLSTISQPCVAGIEYSMGEVLRSGGEVMAEISAPHSLATYAVVREATRPSGWVTVRRESDRSLVRKTQVVT
jgi:hypothetical protein